MFQARHELNDLSDPIAVQFVNAKSDGALKHFLSSYGLPGSFEPPIRYADVLSDLPSEKRPIPVDRISQKMILGWQSIILRILVDKDTKILNALIGITESLRLTPAVSPPRGSEKLAISFTPNDLFGYMLMEVAFMIVGDGPLLTCDHCGSLFIAGSGTGKRSHKKYCSDRCRVAAMRARKRDAAVKPEPSR